MSETGSIWGCRTCTESSGSMAKTLQIKRDYSLIRSADLVSFSRGRYKVPDPSFDTRLKEFGWMLDQHSIRSAPAVDAHSLAVTGHDGGKGRHGRQRRSRTRKKTNNSS